MNRDDLIAFEADIAACFERGEIKGPIHLSGGNEDQLIEIFKNIKRTDYVFSTWRSHYHCLLHGVPPEKLKSHLLNGPSMNVNFPEHRFLTSAIVGGILPIACGVAAGIKRRGEKDKVWCFIGDMAATTGACHEATIYASRHALPIKFVVEDNGLSTNTPTQETWGNELGWRNSMWYCYTRTVPHVGTGKWVTI